MRPSDGTILFKTWLPDQPALNNPGLTEAQNVVPVAGTYRAFQPLTGTETAAPASPYGAIWSSDPSFGGAYVGTQTQLYRRLSTGYTLLSSATYNSSLDYWRFAEYEGLMIATNFYDVPQAHTVASASSFTALATSGTAPVAQHVGIVGQSVVLGNLKDGGTSYPYRVRWSGIDQPRSWPTPNSDTAIAQQSGQEDLNAALGDIVGIYGNDQFGVVFQQGGITRMTYVGGGAVFQFDEYEVGRGLLFPNSAVQVGNLVYYISNTGFCVTDGTQVSPIGAGKVDKYFQSQVNYGYKFQVFGTADYANEHIYWSFCSQTSGAAAPDQLLIYNWREDRWSRASSSHQTPFAPPMKIGALEAPRKIYAFAPSNTLNTFSGTAGTAVIETGEVEPVAGAYARVQGIKPLVDATLNSVTVSLGVRGDQDNAASFGSAVTANSRTGYADFRTEARYIRARVTVSGTFNAAQGIQFQVAPSGAV